MAAPTFFVPGTTDETCDQEYERLARACVQTVPPMDLRIYSITFHHDGDEWTAEIGQTLRGTQVKTRRAKGKKYEQRIPLSDAATVRAIFAGDLPSPFFVHTDGYYSKWANPFMAGRVTEITYFGGQPMRYERG